MLLELDKVSIRYGRVKAVDKLTLNVAEGEVVTVLGANGAGKSSLLRGILGVASFSSGHMRFEGEDIAGYAPHQRVRRGISLVPEGRRILINQTIHENLLLGATARKDLSGFDHELAAVYRQFPNLEARRNLAASCLSGGEQQMLAIGRALLARPRLLMLDEPSLGLSPKIVDEIFRLFRRLNDEGLAILLVEQNTGKALTVAHRGYVLERGRLVATGTPQELAENDQLTNAYLGQSAKEVVS
ncbi:MAG: ABC transporter ATP-binding protein [Pseudomonadota bacterium]